METKKAPKATDQKEGNFMGVEITKHARTLGEKCVNISLVPMDVRHSFGLCTFAPSKSLIFGHF